MRNLSYLEAIVSLMLIAASALGAYQLWFVPALTQTERDRQTIERLLVTLARPLPERAPTAASQVAHEVHGPSLEQLSRPPKVTPKPAHAKHERASHKPKQPFELACADDSKDPLCGALDR